MGVRAHGAPPDRQVEAPRAAAGKTVETLSSRAMPFVSFVVVHWRDRARLVRCLEALRRDVEACAGADDAGDLVELILVENGASARRDGAAASLDAVWPDRLRVPMDVNLGFAAGANAGIALARGCWIATLNDDTEVEPGFLASLLSAAEAAGPRCGMLQPCMVQADDDGLIDSTGVSILHGGSIEDRDHGRPRGRERGTARVFCASAGAAWYRREMLREVAPDGLVFDPDYFMYFEDVDLGWRCRLAGWEAAYVPDAVVRHGRHGSSEAQRSGFVRRQCMQNRLRVVLANGSRRFIVSAFPRLARDVGGLVLDQGWRGIREVARSLSSGLAARRAVPEAARAARSSVERTWFEEP